MGKVLVIRGGAIGDFILTLPAISLLRHGLPDACVDILGYRPVIELAAQAGLADDLRCIEHGSLAGFFAPESELDRQWCEYFSGFDLIISYLHDPDGYFRGNLQRAGVKELLEGISRVDIATGIHAACQLAKVLEDIALFLDDPAPLIHLPDTGDMAGANPVAIHPGSGGAAKNWHLEEWIRLGEGIADHDGHFPILLITGEAEEEKHAKLAEAWRGAGVVFQHAHNWPLTRLGEALSKCRLFLGHDSGISHLAAAVGIPCLLLFGPTDPAIWAPANEKVEVLRSKTGRMSDIAYRDVFKRVSRLLSCL
ncbi:MAG: glycosyltransferase family 9 protein [Verrucomicrobiales bacterium]|nr:glycosyltransferase family 9 protein [Verrucomicrobiales bacterium]MED5585208.1 glycosyltransferase family 9 protein [Verrucomicrobiota bacterium]